MLKRTFCLMLAIVLLVGLIPMGAVHASAARYYTYSEEAVEYIKKWEGFSEKAYWDVNRWTIGYGTLGYSGQTITEKAADRALREELDDIAYDLNEFSSNYNRKFTQNEFDALVSFSLNVGTDWTEESGRFRDAVLNRADGNDFLFAISLWANKATVPDTGLLARRMSEANMYLNGEYTKNPPSKYTYVIFDPNGGTPGHNGEDKMQGYMTNSNVEIMVKDPTKSGQKFLGWFTSAKGGQEVTRLNSSVAGSRLYAHWSGSGHSWDDDDDDVIATGIVTVSGRLNVRKGPGTSYDICAYIANGREIDFYEFRTVQGKRWGSTDLGWVCMDYVRLIDDPDEPDEDDYVIGYVTGTNVNVRRNPGLSSPSITHLNRGDQVKVYEERTADGMRWAHIQMGWISMNYVRLEDPYDPDDPAIYTGTVISSTNLHVRRGPGTNYAAFSSLVPGSRVTIYETTVTNGVRWGRIDTNAWICLNYVRLDQGGDTVLDTGHVNYNTNVHVRSGPGTNYAIAGTLSAGSSVKIYEYRVVNGMRWGRIGSNRWVSMNYITLDDDPGYRVGTGRVTARNGLYIRAGAGTGYATLGALAYGTTVDITEVTRNGGTEWGRTAKGWVCMDYIQIIS